MNLNASLDMNKLADQVANDPATLPALLIALVIVVAIVVFLIVGRWKTVKKLGGHGWSQLIPVYGEWELSINAGCEKALCIALTALSAISIFSQVTNIEAVQGIAGLCGLALFVITILVAYKVARRFGKGKGFTVGLVLLPAIFYAILGLGSAMPNESLGE